MQANVIHTGSVDSFDYLVAPEQNPMNQMYIENQFSNISSTLTDIGRRFMETSKALYDKINDSAAIRMAKAAIRVAKSVFHPNAIIELESLEQLQAAQPIMQRYVMADPTIRRLYHAQQIDGYSDTYKDVEPGKVGHAHYDYRRVMDGMVREVVDADGEDGWVVNTYAEDLNEGDRHLDLNEKVDIINTQTLARMFIEAGEDCTNVFGAKL